MKQRSELALEIKERIAIECWARILMEQCFLYFYKAVKHKLIIASMVIALLFNSVGTLFAASSMLSQAKIFANNDVELICTGSTFKWMSVSIYQQTGKIQFVDAPADAPEGFDAVKCSYSYLNDNKSNHGLTSEQPRLTFENYSNQSIEYINAQYTARKHKLSISRAPPTKI